MRLSTITSWGELIASVAATPLILFYLFALLTSSLNRSVKVFLSMHGLNLLMLSSFQIVVAMYRLSNPGEWRAKDVASNLPLFLHETAYSSCTVSMLLITIERTVMGIKPGLYSDNTSSIRAMVAISVCIAIPSAALLQDGPIINGRKLYSTFETAQKFSLLLFMIFDCSSLTMVIISFIRSSKRYNQTFLKSTLKIRYQVKEVICLTRVLIPICCLSLASRFVSLTLAYFAFSDENKLDLNFTIIRFLCTGAAIIEPLWLLTRHPLLRKRLRRLLGLPTSEVWKPEDHGSRAVAVTYFDAFKRELSKKTPA